MRTKPPGAESQKLAERLAGIECPAFSRRRAQRAADDQTNLPIVLAAGQGSDLWDVDDNAYVDLAAGFGALLLGHGHPAVTEAVRDQMTRLTQGLGDFYASDIKVELLEALSKLHPTGSARVMLGQSGSDAVTAALKTATLATGRHAFVAFDGAYHGLGYGPLPACGYQAGFRTPFAPQLNPEVHYAPYPGVRGASGDRALSFVKQLLRTEKVAGVLVEPLLGRGGCVAPPDSFLSELTTLAHRYGALVIADEIWTGLGRCGAWLRSEAMGAAVDIICLGKGLGGGLPISACLAPDAVMAGWAQADEAIHTSTHGGAPLGCAAALATLSAIRDESLIARSAELGARARAAFDELLSPCRQVCDVRGVGLMIGIELEDGATAQRAIAALLERGYVVLSGGIGGATLTLTPALNIDERKLLGIGECLREILER